MSSKTGDLELGYQFDLQTYKFFLKYFKEFVSEDILPQIFC